MQCKRKKQTEEVEKEEGDELCPKCGNVMIQENGKMVCSSCVDDIDFFGEDEKEPKE